MKLELHSCLLMQMRDLLGLKIKKKPRWWIARKWYYYSHRDCVADASRVIDCLWHQSLGLSWRWILCLTISIRAGDVIETPSANDLEWPWLIVHWFLLAMFICVCFSLFVNLSFLSLLRNHELYVGLHHHRLPALMDISIWQPAFIILF